MDTNKKSAFSKQQSNNDNHSSTESEPIIDDSVFGISRREKVNLSVPTPPESSNIPKRIKIDLSIGLETGLLYTAGAFFFAGLVIYNKAAFGGKHSLPDPSYFLILPIPAIAVAITLICWLFTDNYYIIDTIQRKLLYHYKFLWKKKISDFLDFEQLYAIGVAGRRTQSKNSVNWSYSIMAIDKSGKIIQLSNYQNESAINELNQRAHGMASIVQCNFFGGMPNVLLKTDVSKTSEISLQYVYYETQAKGLEGIKNDFRAAQIQWANFDKDLKQRIVIWLVMGVIIIIAFMVILPAVLKIR
ncbi:MAG: hypothetical protein QMC67_09465 [Candidatus Wallbacteria bacterium]